MATMIAVTILALLFIVGVAFFSLASTERAASLRHLDVLRSHYIAEAGVSYLELRSVLLYVLKSLLWHQISL